MISRELLVVCLYILLFTNNVFAFQNCQIKYDSDKRSLPELRGMCNVCHLSPSGSGPQNEFGRAFANAGFKITDEIVSKFPNLFQKPQSNESPTLSLAPQIRKIKPSNVKVNVQSMVSIMGRNFVEGAKAFIDENEVITAFKSSMLLIIDFVLDALGLHDLKVENPDKHESNTVKIKAK